METETRRDHSGKMTDTSELVRRLRFWMPIGSKNLEEDLAVAADRLEALEAEVGRLNDELHAIKYEIMGGEDVPGSAHLVTLEDVKREGERGRNTELRAEALEAELGNLLAIIHRDGGHHTGKVGYRQSVKDAHLVWAKMMSCNEALEAENKRLREALEALTNHLDGDVIDVGDRLAELIAAARAALKEET